MVAPPTMGIAVPGQFDTAAFWNAQVQALGNFILNPPRFMLAANASQAVLTGQSPNTSILMQTETLDTVGGHSTTTNISRYTCQVAGLYSVVACGAFQANNVGARSASVALNGVTITGAQIIAFPPTSNTWSVTINVMVQMNVGDYIELQMWNTSGLAAPGLNTAFATPGLGCTLAGVWVSN